MQWARVLGIVCLANVRAMPAKMRWRCYRSDRFERGVKQIDMVRRGTGDSSFRYYCTPNTGIRKLTDRPLSSYRAGGKSQICYPRYAHDGCHQRTPENLLSSHDSRHDGGTSRNPRLLRARIRVNVTETEQTFSRAVSDSVDATSSSDGSSSDKISWAISSPSTSRSNGHPGYKLRSTSC